MKINIVPNKLSLKLEKEFKVLYKHGIRKNSNNFQLIFVDSNLTKIAFVVSKKNIPKASHRIYSKRLVREIFRTDILTTIKKPLHLSIHIKSNLYNLKKQNSDKNFYNNIKNELIELFNQINFDAPAYKKDQKRTFNH